MANATQTAQQYGATIVPPPATSPYQDSVSKFGGTIVSAPPENPLTSWLGIQNPSTYVPDSINQATSFAADPLGSLNRAVNTGLNAIGGAINTAFTSTEKAASDFSTPTSIPQTTADVLHAAVSDVSLFPLWQAINGAYSTAEQLPVFKQAADVLNAPFAVIGKIGNFGAGTFVDVLPVSQATKDIIKPAFEEVGSFAAQMILGGEVIHMAAQGLHISKGIMDKAVTDSKAAAVISSQQVDAHSGNTPVTDNSPTETSVPFNNKYTPDAQLPTIDMGSPAKDTSGLPSIQQGEPTPPDKMAPFSVEPPVTPNTPESVTTPVENSTTPQNTAQTVPNVPVENSTGTVENSTTATTASTPNEPIKTGNEKVNTTSVTQDSMQEHLTPEEFEKYQDSTAHEKQIKVEQAQKTANFVNDYPTEADKIAFEGKATPEGISHQDVLTELKLKAEQDYKSGKITLDEYQKYNRAYERYGSHVAGELGKRAGAFDPNDPAAFLKKATDALQRPDTTFSKDGKGTSKTTAARERAAKTMKEVVTKAAAKKMDYQKIIDSIKDCI